MLLFGLMLLPAVTSWPPARAHFTMRCIRTLIPQGLFLLVILMLFRRLYMNFIRCISTSIGVYSIASWKWTTCEPWTGRCLLSKNFLDKRTGAEKLELMSIFRWSFSFNLLQLFRQAAKCMKAVELHFHRVMYTLEVEWHIFLKIRWSLSLFYAANFKQSQDQCLQALFLVFWTAFVNTFCIDHCIFAYWLAIVCLTSLGNDCKDKPPSAK